MDRSIMNRGDCWLIPQGEKKDMIRQMLEKEVGGTNLEESLAEGLQQGEERRGESLLL